MYYKIFHISTSAYLKQKISKVDNSYNGPLNPLNEYPNLKVIALSSNVAWYCESLEDMKFYSKNDAENILHKKLFYDIFWQTLCLNEFELHEFNEDNNYVNSYNI